MPKAVLILLFAIMFSGCAEKKSPALDIDWVFVEGGEFTMGMDEPLISPGGDTIPGYTTPAHRVTVDDFYISKYEITYAQFRQFCEATGREVPKAPAVSSYGDSIDFVFQDNHPMLVTWREADAFARWAGGRLPTEAEWEYAAEGGKYSKGYAYSGSDTATVVGWVGENSDSIFHPIGLLRPNELGIYDMTGNLHEWVSDWWDPDYDYLNSPTDNPTGPDSGVIKMNKGVGWYYNSVDNETREPLKYTIHRSEVRYQSGMDERSYGFGMRIVKDAK